jgi:hypothetical protein
MKPKARNVQPITMDTTYQKPTKKSFGSFKITGMTLIIL